MTSGACGRRAEVTVVSTSQLVAAGRWSGTVEAGFADVYAAHHGAAVRLAFLLCGDIHRAEDAVADAFVKVYRRWRRGGIVDPGAYVRRAVVNQVNSRFRRLALERREAAKRSGDDRGRRSPEDDVAEADVLLRALATLPVRQRTAIVLRYYADLSVEETAAVMSISPGTVKSTVSRGMESLRRVLAGPDQEATR